MVTNPPTSWKWKEKNPGLDPTKCQSANNINRNGLQVVCFSNPAKLIYKHTADSKNVQKNKKKEKGEFIGCQVSTNQCQTCSMQ